MIINPSSMHIPSIDDFTCRHFQQFFSDGNKQGFITTQNNNRTYHIVWDTTTDTLSVKRDLTNVDGWTRFSEIMERWSQFDFRSNAEKWKSRLTIQKHNVALAEPLKNPTRKLLKHIESINTYIDIKSNKLASKVIHQHLNQISTPLTQSLQEQKKSLFEQAQQFSFTVNEGLDSDHLWGRQQNTKIALFNLHEQARQLTFFIANIKNILGLYSVTLGSIDVSRNTMIYDAVLSRVKFVAIKIQLMIETYFAAGGNVSKAEINNYNQMIKNEGEIALTLNLEQISTHFVYNDLLSSPRYRNDFDANAQKQGQIDFNYQMHIITFTSLLINPLNTMKDIQNAAEDLKLTRSRWQEQILLEEELRRLLRQLDDEEVVKEKFPVLIQYREQLRDLRKNVYNNGELLRIESWELLQSQYQNMERANTLYMEIDQFLANLPGFNGLWETSNYNSEMQSRILHLSILRSMCKKEESLAEHTLDHMEHFVTVHINVLQQWIASNLFFRLTFYDPIPADLDYPKWLLKEHNLFQRRVQDIKSALWETAYQNLRNSELLKARGELLAKVEVKSEELVLTTEAFKESVGKLHCEHSFAAQVSH